MEKYTLPDGGTSPKICIVGAGFSGLTAAIKLKTDLKLSSFQIFDENEDVGGTWLVNTYPGVACDVPSHMYSWSFELNPDWSKSFSPGPEIWEYMRRVATKYDLYRHVRFNSQVVKMEWDEKLNQWRVTVLDKRTNQEQTLLFDIVISGPGALRLPNYPKEFESFTGPKVHTAEWDSSIDLENKVVGVIGSGASAVQVITEIAPAVKELHCYQRKPAWITPRDQYAYSATLKWLFRYVPFFMWFYRAYFFLSAEFRHRMFTYGSWRNRFYTWLLTLFIKKQIPKGDPKLDQLIPSYTLGCKRIIRSSDYYPALALSHVKIIRDKIAKVSGNEIGTENGESQKLDVLILATGFQVQNFFYPMKVIGKDGVDVLAQWRDDAPVTYYGICSPLAPNMFILLGPNTGLGHNTAVFMIECQVKFTMDIIREMMRRKVRSVTVKSAAADSFLDRVEKKMKTTVWMNGNCGSWYANARGVITTIWPWTCTRYWMETKKVDHHQFEYE